ncbi:MAG: ribonuclease E inhibitor RraB, partial [Aeromonas sp.]
MQEWRDETTEIVNELLADGSNPDADYDIEHHFACQDFDRLEKAAVDLFKAG